MYTSIRVTDDDENKIMNWEREEKMIKTKVDKRYTEVHFIGIELVFFIYVRAMYSYSRELCLFFIFIEKQRANPISISFKSVIVFCCCSVLFIIHGFCALLLSFFSFSCASSASVALLCL